MHHPVEPGPQQQDYICPLEGGRAGGGDRAAVSVWNDPLPHGRGEEGQVGAAHQAAHRRLGAGVGGALAHDHQGAPGGAEEGGGAMEVILELNFPNCEQNLFA